MVISRPIRVPITGWCFTGVHFSGSDLASIDTVKLEAIHFRSGLKWLGEIVGPDAGSVGAIVLDAFWHHNVSDASLRDVVGLCELSGLSITGVASDEMANTSLRPKPVRYADFPPRGNGLA